ncbi:MAG: hypothetical protein ACFCVG_15590 [Kineosporiaceae bacterium]
MTIIEIIVSTLGSEGDYDSRVVECDAWHWGARLDAHRDGVLVAQFAAEAVLGVVDLTALAEVEDEEDEEDEEEDLEEDLEDDEPEVPPAPLGTAP